MRGLLEFLAYVPLRLFWAVARLLPLPMLRGLLEGAALLVRQLDRRHRCVVRENLERAFPAERPAWREQIERGAFRCWGRIAAELVHADELLDPDRIAGMGQIRAALADRADDGGEPGLLVLTAHTGNYELLARICARATGRRIWIFHRAMNNRFADGFLTRQREAAGVGLLGRGSGVRQAIAALRRGDILAVPLDQNQQPGRGIFVDFFGVPASTSTMLARLSLACRVPVLPVFAQWSGNHQRVEVGRRIEPPRVGRSGRARRTAFARELTELQQRIYAAVAYRDVFQFPPTIDEIHRFLPGGREKTIICITLL